MLFQKNGENSSQMILCAKYKKIADVLKDYNHIKIFRNYSTFIFSVIETSFDECKKINKRKKGILGSMLTIRF